MLYLNDLDTIENVTVFGDDKKWNKFYLIPEQPRFRVDEKGRPIFKFIKYRFPIDRPDGLKGGGYVAFDVEFTVPDDKLSRIKEKLEEKIAIRARKRGVREVPALEIGQIKYLDGNSRINIGNEDGVLVQKIFDAGKPSLYGKNISTYTVQLTDVGATFFEKALQGKGGFVGVIYEGLTFHAKLPKVKVKASWNASAYYSFIQDIDIQERRCSEDDYRETLRETMRRSESQNIEILNTTPNINEKVIDGLRSWARASLDSAVERLMIEALPVEDPAEARKWYKEHDIEDVRKVVSRSRVSNYSFDYSEDNIIEDIINPQGLLPNITTLEDKEGNPIDWNDYSETVDLDDPFFKQLNVAVRVNAPFNELPIHSVEVKLMYKGEPMNILESDIDGEFVFTSPDDVAKFSAYVEDDDWNYQWQYTVNFLNESKSYQSEVMTTNDSQLTVNVDNLGLLLVDVVPGAIDFKQIPRVQIDLEYDAPGVDRIEHQFTLDENNPYYRIDDVIIKPRTENYRYKIRYFLENDQEYVLDRQSGFAEVLTINDPFIATKDVQVRAVGDLDDLIDTIYIDLIYQEGTAYRQTKSIALTSRRSFDNFKIPQVDPAAGVLSYSGNIMYKDGTMKEIEKTTTNKDTLYIGESVADLMEIEVIPDLIDFYDEVKMVRLKLTYEHGSVKKRKSMVFSERNMDPAYWEVKLADADAVTYSWEATYYMRDGSRVSTEAKDTDELSLILEVPVTTE